MTSLEELKNMLDDEEFEVSSDSYNPESSEESSDEDIRQSKKKWNSINDHQLPSTSFGTAQALRDVTGQQENANIHEEIEDESVTVELEDNAGAENLPPEIDVPAGKASVKRKIRDIASWKSHKRSTCYQAGKAYTSRRGVEMPAKKIKNFRNCVNNCKYKCGVSVGPYHREALFKAFYKMSQNEKYHFILNTTNRDQTERPKSIDVNFYKNFSFFNVGSNKIQVCKKFYLGTLSISQKPVYNVHKNKDELTSTPKQDGRGKSSNSSRRLSEVLTAVGA
ncbi:hypothetical protein J6590_100092 [Homalodisca vitripennis]|nr:hypothetical protein J6590_100092 [Homalodisca vitripennis]